MIYISAQPDTQYFEWQLELQLRNFKKLGIYKENIHVLIAYNSQKGLDPNFDKFINEHQNFAEFYLYPDNRINRKYASSVRPHILKQHFKKLDWLQNETIFYHDSDILFSRIPNVPSDGVCYVSDTRNYLDINYLQSVCSDELINEMLLTVGVSKDIILQNDNETGGAQYVLSNISDVFWDKVETDSEQLFSLMKQFNHKLWQDQYKINKQYRTKGKGVQAWCSDMWAVLWNLWYFDKNVKICKEMDFSWPTSPLVEWEEKAIQHYSGNISKKELYFKKTDYVNFPPWYDENLFSIPATNCSFKIVEQIKIRKKELDHKRKSFTNNLILLSLSSLEEIEQARIIHRYIAKYLDINVFFKINNEILDSNFKKIPSEIRYRDYLSIVEFSACYIIDVFEIVSLLELTSLDVNQYFINESYRVDKLFFETFSKVLEVDLFKTNKGKMNTGKEDRLRIILHKNQNLENISNKMYLDNLQYKPSKEIITESFNLC